MLLHLESFEHIATMAAGPKWDAISGAIATVTSPVRTGSRAYRMNAVQYIRKHIGAIVQNATVIVGAAIYRASNNDQFTGVIIFQPNTGGTTNINVSVERFGDITVSKGTTLLNASGTSQNGGLGRALPMDKYAYIEVKVYCHATTGTIEVRVNGQVRWTYTGNTVTTNAYTAAVQFGGACTWDDIYIVNGQAAAGAMPNNDFLGPLLVSAIVPTGVGAEDAWLNVGSASGWQNVDELPGPSTTDYTYSETVGAIETYALGDIDTSYEVMGVAFYAWTAASEAVTARTIQSVFRLGGVNYVGASAALAAASYSYYRQLYDSRPSDNQQWTPTDINAVEAGLKLVS